MNKPWQLKRYLRLAEVLIRERRLGSLGRDADDKLLSASRSRTIVLRVREDMTTLVALLKAYATGEYRDIPTKSLILGAAGILYFVTPVDVIPDFLLGIGYLDDLTVLTYVIGIIRGEIERFRNRPISSGAQTINEVIAPATARTSIPATVSRQDS